MDPAEYEPKESHHRRRRLYKSVENLHKAQRKNILMEKFIDDPLKELSKKRQKALMNDDSDGMLHGVRYSVNKHGRWKIANAESLLPGRQTEDMDVVFIDHAYTFYRNGNQATSVSILHDDDSLTTARQDRHTCQEQILMSNAAGKSLKELQKPRIEYVVHKVNPDPIKLRARLVSRETFGRHWWDGNKERWGATNEKYLEDREDCDSSWREESEEEEEMEKKEKREYRLNLDECIRQPSTNQKAEKRQRRKHLSEGDTDFVFV